ncbi:hypothetical protein [uncultured Pseudomonas sp.]|uniref:hypothetical protein n=1 Tax=uncultured Pseudomonas sp. TaxID=114707 RepID=UPI002598BBAE|nr:hypothetical protein [uncultured Pseudomonas sp.]
MVWEAISCWIEGHPGLASWVQAIGSILAIGAAGLFPFVHERAKEKRLRRNTLRSLLHLSVSLRDLQLRIRDSLANDGRNLRWLKGDGPAELNQISQLISELPASLFVGFEMACLSDMRICAGFAQEMHSIILLSKSSQIDGIYDMDELLNSNQRKINQIERVIKYLESS